MTPGIVCAAFSVELYLKLLNCLSFGKAPRGHKLDELFAPLPVDVKSALGQKFTSGTLDANIAQMGGAFVEWRYKHEHEALQINPDALIGVAAACHLQNREMNPSLKVFGENTTV